MSRATESGLAPPGPLLPKGRLTGPMPWVIAIMMFLTVLASAAGLSLDAAFGTAIGAGIALVVTALLGQALHAVTSDLVRSATLPGRAWLTLILLPVVGVAVAWLAARVTLHRALERSL
jgi:hypothetical protein